MSKLNRRQNFATQLAKTPSADFEALFESAPVALVRGNWVSSFEVLNANSEALRLFSAKDKTEFDKGFNGILNKIPKNILLDLLSARVKNDSFESEFRLPRFHKGTVYISMRLAYMPMHLGTQNVILAFQDITQSKKHEIFLKNLSQLDGLTKVLNQRAIMERLQEELMRAKRYALNLSCIIFDLDLFKRINDSAGHLVGSRCLNRVAMELKSSFRKTDIIGRYGGDEFLVILPETNSQQAVVPINRFLNNFAPHKTLKLKNKNLEITFSIGIANFPDTNVQNSKDLIKSADAALYLSKSQGGNQYHFSGPPLG